MTDVRAGGDHVFADVDWKATGAASGIQTSSHWYLVFTLRDAKIVRMEYFSESRRAEALRVAGLQA